MSLNLLKNSEPPCMPSGCGDNSSILLGIEQKKLFQNRIVKKSQHSSLCRRDAYKVPNANVRRAESCTKISTPTCYRSGKLKPCKRASSLEDLTPKRLEEPNVRRKRPTQMPTKIVQVETDEEECSAKILQAARRVCQVMLINAWRRKRQDCQLLTMTVEQLGTQVDNLNIQTIVLKRLLDSEKERVLHAGEDVQAMISQMEASSRETEAVKKEKGELEQVVNQLEEKLCEANTRHNNLKNDFLTAREEVATLESQLTKERDKLAKLREDKKHLMDKVQAAEETVQAKATTIERLLTKVTELKNKLHAQDLLSSAAEAANQALKQLKTDQAQLANDLKEMQASSLQMKVRVQVLEQQLSEKDIQKRTLEKTVQEQQLEILNLRLEIQRHTELSNSWSNRALHIASLFARFPLAIFQNLAFLFMPYTPPSG